MYKKIIFLTIISFILISCNSQREIRIGFAGSLSGSNHEIGVASKNGFQMAIDDLNNSDLYNSVTFVPIIRDDLSDPDEALNIINDFKTESVFSAVGFITSNMYPAIVKANEEEILLISPSISTPKLTGKDDFFIRVIQSMEFEAKELARRTREIEVTKLSIVYEMSNDIYSVKYFEEFRDEYLSKNNEIVFHTALEDSSYDDIVNDIIANDSNGICLITSAHNASEILQRLNVKNVDIPIALSQWTMSSDLIIQAGQSSEGAYGYSSYNRNISTPDYEKFSKSYVERYKIEPSFISLTSYEATQLLCQSLLKNSSIEDIKSDIVNATYTGLQNDFLINEYGDAIRMFYLVHIEDGIIVPLE